VCRVPRKRFMDLGFAVAEAEGDWGDDEETQLVPAEDPIEVEDEVTIIETPQAPAATAIVPVPKAAVAPSESSGPPKSKIHSNPRTRYFVIKSNSHKNIVLSVENNVWATPRYNEDKFNEALRSAPHVILAFSVNQSGCFQGYAKMTSAVGSSRSDVFRGFGRGFEVRWLRLEDLDFSEVSDLLNPWNENKSVKISRDGQELPNDVGQKLCQLVDAAAFKGDPESYMDDSKEVETGGFDLPAEAPTREPQAYAPPAYHYGAGAPSMPPPGHGMPPPGHGMPPPGHGLPPPGYGLPPPGHMPHALPPLGHALPPGGYMPWGHHSPWGFPHLGGAGFLESYSYSDESEERSRRGKPKKKRRREEEKTEKKSRKEKDSGRRREGSRRGDGERSRRRRKDRAEAPTDWRGPQGGAPPAGWHGSAPSQAAPPAGWQGACPTRA